MYCVYVVYNHKHGKTYTGETEDLNERLKAHNDHRFEKSYTARFDGSWELVYSEKYPSRQEARKREKELKSYRGRQFVKQYIPR
ncbi:endonuclease [bacterium]|nr:endonuclease [bacterium]